MIKNFHAEMIICCVYWVKLHVVKINFNSFFYFLHLAIRKLKIGHLRLHFHYTALVRTVSSMKAETLFRSLLSPQHLE